MFQLIKNTKQGIRPPQSQTVIIRGQSEFRPGEIIYMPPHGEGIVEMKIENMYQFLNSQNNFDPLLKMAIAHFQFEAIHPFTDCNGRTVCILNLLYLVDKKLLSFPVLYLSKHIINHKDDYYHLLSGVTQRLAWKPWILFILDALEKTAKYTNEKIDEIISQMSVTYSYAHAHEKLKWYSFELNQALFSPPYIRPKLIGDII